MAGPRHPTRSRSSGSTATRHFVARTVCAIIVPLPTSAVADAVPCWTLVELEMRACSDSMCVPTGTLLATKLNDAASSVERISSISSGVTQFGSTTMLVVPSGFVTVVRQPPIAPSSVAESVCVRAAYVTTPGGIGAPSISDCTWIATLAVDVSFLLFLLRTSVWVNSPDSRDALTYTSLASGVLMGVERIVTQPFVPDVCLIRARLDEENANFAEGW